LTRWLILLAFGAGILVSAGVWWVGASSPSAPPRGTAPRSSGSPVGRKPATQANTGNADITRPRRVRVVRRSHAAVPILMYHVIAAPYPGAPFPGLYVPPAQFRAQMVGLARAGYRAVTLDRVRRAWLGRARLPRHPIVLTFDNGYRTQYTQALPILRRLGWVGVENLQLQGLPPSVGGLRRRQIRALVAAGWELDTQGQSHADLTGLDAAQLRFQIDDARRLLRRRYHVPVDWFCYPSGDYDAAVVAAVKEAGFVGSTTVIPGWARPGDDSYRLPRLRVLGGTSPAELLRLISGARQAASVPASYLPPA
jgi:peptidoglycan/xylan/chitin deacetylase (PgdA/CDA1 family)